MSFFKGIANKIGKGVATANIKSQQMMNISRLNLAIKGKEDDISRLHRRLGIAVYQSWDTIKRGSSTPEIDEIIQGIRDLNREIIALKRERMDLQGKMECPGCKKVIPKDEPTCPACGKELTVRDLLNKPSLVEETVESSDDQQEATVESGEEKVTSSQTDSPKQPEVVDQIDQPSESEPTVDKPSITSEARAEAKEDSSMETSLDHEKEQEANPLPKGKRAVVKADLEKKEPTSVEEKVQLNDQNQQEKPSIQVDDSENEELSLGGSPIFVCYQCGHQVDENKSTCPHCGTSF